MWVIEKQILVCFALSLRMVFGRSGKFISKFRGYFKLSFIMVEVDNLYINLEGYIELSFMHQLIILEVGNLEPRGYFMYYNNKGG